MKNLKVLAFIALVGIGQTMISCEKNWTEEQRNYAKELQKRIEQPLNDRAPRVLGYLNVFASTETWQDTMVAAYSDACNILHQEEFQHCSNNLFRKIVGQTPECKVVRYFIGATLKHNSQMPDYVERYQESRERFYAAKKAVQ